ncbi:MFS transporter [Paenibacillus flagellatus]|uniref:MFS transporter n=2 Tax=Paenibacillus flagellatus TaxID=2211139 RepID=A0A2V5KFW8_9BACL|nr:MFS transporter [Paenibacillus flagellatus]
MPSSSFKRPSAAALPPFVRLAAVLFVMEFVRSAFLISFLPAYAAGRLGVSVAAVGLAVSIHYVADTAVKAAAGYLVDRFSSRLMLHAAFGTTGAGLLTAFFGQQPWMLVVGAILIGIGVSPIWLLCMSEVREDNRASQMGSIYTVWLASLGAGPVVMGFLLDRGYGVSFGVLGGLLAFGWAVALGWNVRRGISARSVPLREQLAQLGGKLAAMKPLVPGMVLQTAAAGLLVPVLPTFATDNMGLDYSGYSLVLIVGGAATAVGLIPMGRLSDRWGHRRFLVVGFAGLAAALFLLLSSSGLVPSMLLAAVLGLSYAVVLPSWNALLASFVPDDQKGTGWGVLSSIEGIGVMIGPVVGGWVAGTYDPSVTVGASAVLLAGIAAFYGFFPQRRLTSPEQTE